MVHSERDLVTPALKVYAVGTTLTFITIMFEWMIQRSSPVLQVLARHESVTNLLELLDLGVDDEVGRTEKYHLFWRLD